MGFKMILRFIALVLLVSFSNSLKIAIVGAGPSGLVLASRILSSSTANVDQVDILECRDDPRLNQGHRSFAIGVNSRTWAALELWSPSLVQELKDNYCSYIQTTTNIIENKKQAISSNFRYMTNQPLFVSGLLTGLENLAKYNSKSKLNVLFKTKCLAVDSTTGTIVYCNDKNQTLISTYDLIVGSDGANSVVRSSVISQPTVRFEGFQTSMKWKFVSVNLPTRNASCFYVYKDTIGGWWYMPSGRSHLVCFWKPNNKNQLSNPDAFRTVDKAKSFLTHMLGEDPVDLQTAAEYLVHSKPSSETIFKLNKYHHEAGKVVLLGDAAHSMSSALGQGMSCSIEDATCLYTILDRYQWKATALPKALTEYSKERVPEGNAITDLNFVSVCRRIPLVGTLFFVSQLIEKLLFRRPLLFEELRNPIVKFETLLKRFSLWANIGRFFSERFIRNSANFA